MDVKRLEDAAVLREAAAILRRLAEPSKRTVLEAYLYDAAPRLAQAFAPDRCREAANLLEEFAEKLEAAAYPPHN